MKTDTLRTDALMIGGCIAITILEHARTLERELNNATPAPVWPEILRLKGKIADLEGELQESKAQSHGLARRVVEAETKLEAEIEHIKTLLKNPSAVHINTLRGTIAGLSWDGYEHILGPHPCRERAEKAEAEVEFWKAKAYEAEEMEGKHEAEVERLKRQLDSLKPQG